MRALLSRLAERGFTEAIAGMTLGAPRAREAGGGGGSTRSRPATKKRGR
eukprot:gene7859-5715_t